MSGTSALTRVRVVLCGTTHPGNIGATARAMKTMGLEQLFLVAPKRFPDPEADARSVHALDVLADARVCETLEEALADTVLACALTARRRHLAPEVVSPREAAPLLLAEAKAGDVAIVFGPEASGLTSDEVSLCQRVVHIPTNPEYVSLNLAAAVQIMAYELRVAARLHGAVETQHVAPAPASFEEVEAFHRHLHAVLLRIGFLDPRRPGRLVQRLRRLFARARLEKEEVAILRGVLKMIDGQTAAVAEPNNGGVEPEPAGLNARRSVID